MRLIYDQISPITGNKSVLVEPDAEKGDNLWICMETGYHTYELKWKDGSDIIQYVEENLPPHVINTKFIDKNGNVWYYIILINPFLILSPVETDDGMAWELCPLENTSDMNDVNIVMVIGGGENSDEPAIYRKKAIQHRRLFSFDKFASAFELYQSVTASVYGKVADMFSNNNEEE